MKIKYFALSLLACVGMMSCSNNDDLAGDDGQKGDGDVARSYVAVNILNTNSDGTRVAGAEYEDGKGNENKITSARFYFFKSDGNAYPLSTASSVSGTADNYIDVTPASSTDGADENIDKVFDAVLVFDAVKLMNHLRHPPASHAGQQDLAGAAARRLLGKGGVARAVFLHSVNYLQNRLNLAFGAPYCGVYGMFSV